MTTCTDPDLHLVVDGERINPIEATGVRFRFRVPTPLRDARLVSRVSVPERLGLSDDARCLGFAVWGIRIERDGVATEIPLGLLEASDGFYETEPGPYCWTNGDARLPATVFGDVGGERLLVVTGHGMPEYAPPVAGAADTKLFGAFESLGENCEFGFVQAHFGVNSMGLLRWARTTDDKLARGLETRFDGLGDPAAAKLVWNAEFSEYRLRDERFLTGHTFKGARCRDPRDEDVLKVRGCARWRLLSRKLLNEIEAGEKIFVFASDDTEFGAARLARLHTAMRRIGPAPLLGVIVSRERDRAGSVDIIGDGLMLGRIDRFVLHAGPYDTWRTICRRAHAIGRPGTA